MPTVAAYAAHDPTSPLAPHRIERREPGPRDVQIEIAYCGVCHSDLHTARNEWGGHTKYPCVPGHEIVGRVSAVGAEVTKVAVGATAAVGCMVDSCRECDSCRAGFEQYCDRDQIAWTYNSKIRRTNELTYGGYSSRIVVDEAFCLRVPDALPLAAAAPLLCAGVTTWSPLVHWGAGRGKKIGVVGLGGLGHMAVKLSHAFAAETVVFTASPGKAEDARRLGADAVVIAKDAAAMKAQRASFDLIIDTVAAPHDLDALVTLLKRDATLVLLGVPAQPNASANVVPLIDKRRRIAGSLIGGIRETQEMLDFCGAHGIASDIELIPIQRIDEAYERMARSDVKYRFVIDMGSLSA